MDSIFVHCGRPSVIEGGKILQNVKLRFPSIPDESYICPNVSQCIQNTSSLVKSERASLELQFDY